MAFTVVLFSSFYKPDNSTRIPSGGDSFACNAVEPCGVVNPVISFAQGNGWNPSSYNYAQIPEWGRYYYINEWTFDKGRWFASMVSDPMTSFRGAILSREEYVIRSESEYDGDIIDQLYPAKSEFRVVSSQFKPFPYSSLSSGTFVLGVANGRSSSKGGITYYCGSQSDMSELFEFMYSSTDWLNGADIDDISNDLLKCLVEPAQFLSSMMWFPLSVDQIKTNVSAYVGAGWWQTDVLLPYVGGTVDLGGKFKRGTHPQAGRGNYLNYQPYTEFSVYIPPFGNISLNTFKFPVGKDIRFSIQIDTVTGVGTLFLYPDGEPVGSGQVFQAQIGVPIAITTFKSDLLGALTSIGSAVGNATNITSAIFGTVGAVGDAAKLISPDVSVVGSNGNMSVYANNASATAIYKTIADEDIGHHGRPLFKKRLLSSLRGYTQIRDFDTNLPCTLTEQQQIKAYAESGMYIE